MATVRITLDKWQPFSPLPPTLPANAQNDAANSVAAHCQRTQLGGESSVMPNAENRHSGHGNQRENR